ncbi:hypothetical protein [Burkholderia oklahomensis]|uniref:hypothetical protein n=1 Tax=Burkholderia oklahomensis TaxID=342113 RepID=UPI000AE9B544|nr:hypothetical protein [Burkholderia oklahomensis]MBI0362268.1 hypothetical protein [Burkholderia oklahomensis]
MSTEIVDNRRPRPPRVTDSFSFHFVIRRVPVPIGRMRFDERRGVIRRAAIRRAASIPDRAGCGPLPAL